MLALLLNISFGILMILTLSFCTTNVEQVLSSPLGVAGFPFIQIIYNATRSLAATTFMVTIPLISLTGSVVAEIATASRQLWSFARDGGIPFPVWVATVRAPFVFVQLSQ